MYTTVWFGIIRITVSTGAANAGADVRHKVDNKGHIFIYFTQIISF